MTSMSHPDDKAVISEFATIGKESREHDNCPEQQKCSNVPTNRISEATMTITTISSREFNQDTSGAKKAANSGPVFITDRGRPAHVLLTFQEYERVTRSQESIVDLLALPAGADIEFEAPKLSGDFFQPADL